MTFDVYADVWVGRSYSWQSHHELAVICRRCQRISALKVKLNDVNRQNDFAKPGSITRLSGDLEPTFATEGFVSVAELSDVAEAPEHLPVDVDAAFTEGAKCLAIGCYNAAGAMFRLSLDLTTKPLLPGPNSTNGPQPSKRQRYVLADRIDWLIEQRLIAPELATLAHAVRQDGNDGSHDGSLTEQDAEDLLDFTVALLQRQFTEPARLRLAEQRRLDRRQGPARTD